MADWDALAKEAGFTEVSTTEPPPVKKPSVQRFGKAEQADRFAVDVAARAAGSFAGWPVDTINNIVNLGRAAIGGVPESARLVGRGINLLGGEYMGSLNPASGLNWLGDQIEPYWPRPELSGPISGSSEHITQGYRNLASLTGSPVEGVAPSGPVQEFAGNVGQIVGGGIGIGGAPKTAVGLAKLLASGVGAEAGRSAGVAVAPESNLAPVLGSLAGGVALPSVGSVYRTGGPIINTVRAMTQAGKEAGPEITAKAGPLAEKIIDRAIKARVQEYPGAAANIDEALRLQGKFPGVKMSVAEMADAPGLADMQARFAGLTPKNLNREVTRLTDNIVALRAELDKRLPGKPEGAQDALSAAVSRSLAEQETQLAAAQKALSTGLADQSPRAAGEKLLDIAGQQREAVKANVIRPAYEKAFAAAGERRFDIGNVLAEAEGILGRKLSDFAPETAPNTVRLLRSFEPKKGAEQTFFGEPVFVPEGAAAKKPMATLQQLDDVRKAINADILQAKTSTAPTADMTLRNLSKLHGAIDAAVTNSNLPQAAKAAYAEALSTYREQYVPTFKTGVNANLFRRTSLNEPRLNPDDVVKTYFQAGGEREAGQFVKMFGKNPEAKNIAKVGIEDLYRRNVVDPVTGAVDAAKAARFSAQYARPIAIMDRAGMGIGDRLSSIGQRASELSAIRGALDEKAKRLNFETSDDLKAGVLKSPVTMAKALGEMDRSTKGALARSLLEDGWKLVADDQKNGGSKFATYLADNERALKQSMVAVEGAPTATKHFRDIQDIAKTLQRIESADVRGKLTGGAGNDPLRAATGVGIVTVYAQTRAVLAGRQGVGTAVAMIAAPVLTKLSQIQFDDVMNRALHDPQTAVALRNFLEASPQQVAGKGAILAEVWNAAKVTGKALPGFAAKHWAGVPSYPSNLSRLAPTYARGLPQPAEETEQ